MRMGSCSQPPLVAWMKVDLIQEVSFRSCEPVIEQLEHKTERSIKIKRLGNTYKVGWAEPVVSNV